MTLRKVNDDNDSDNNKEFEGKRWREGKQEEAIKERKKITGKSPQRNHLKRQPLSS